MSGGREATFKSHPRPLLSPSALKQQTNKKKEASRINLLRQVIRFQDE